MRRIVAPLVVLAHVWTLFAAATGFAASDDALRCQMAIGETGREYAVARLRALVECNNDTAAGRACDVAQRDRAGAKAARALARGTAKACGGVELATLLFPGRCPDATQGSFSVEDLARCIEAIHGGIADDAIAYEYPSLQTFAGAERSCQRELGRASSAFVATDMRIRTRCLDARLRGTVPEQVDCLAEVPPYGPGTGDAPTDRAATQATVRLMSRLGEACAGADLAQMGFPGRCTEPVVGDVGLVYVANCMRAEHAFIVRHMLGVEYPPLALPTPTPAGTPTPTATPVVESLRLSPAVAKKFVGTAQNFTAIAQMSDGNERNFTQRVVYSSSDPSIGYCPNTDGNRGRVETVGPGRTFITATDPVSGITSSPATLTVTSCTHAICTAGEALAAECEPCVTAVCAANASCCTDAWNQDCIDAVSSLCLEAERCS